jgi:hypothetical protein
MHYTPALAKQISLTNQKSEAALWNFLLVMMQESEHCPLNI